MSAPDAVRLATASYREEMDVVQRFLDERCRVSLVSDVGSTDLYTAYKEWAQNGGERPMTQTRFGSRMADLGFRKERAGATGRKVYIGLNLENAP